MKTIKFSILYFTLFGICFLPVKSLSQDVDSLILKYTDKGGKVDIDSILAKGNYLMHSSPKGALEIARRAIFLSEKQRDPLDLANSFQYQGVCFAQLKTNFDSAFHYFDKAERLYRANPSSKSTVGLGRIQHNSGTIRETKGDYLEAIDHYINALRLFDEVNDMRIRPFTLNNMSTLYSSLEDYDKAEKYARQCIMLAGKAGNELLVATGQSNLADILMSQGRYEHALPLLKEVLKYAEKYNDPNKKFLYYFNHGEYYLHHEKNYDLAVQEFERAKQIIDSLGQDWNLRGYNSSLSQAYLLNEQYEKAYETAEKSLRTAEQQGAKNTRQVTLSVLAQANANRRNYEEAYRQMHSAYLLKDTVFDENSRRHIAFLEAEYQTEKKETRIATLEKERRLYWGIFIASLLGLLWFLLALYLRHRVIKAKKELSEQEIMRLEKEKQLIATQANLEGEITERSRLARDLHDGLGGMLSAVKLNLFDMKKGGALLASEEVLRFNKVLEMLDSSITELRRVAHNMMPESLSRYGLKVSLQDFCDSLQNVHFHFFGNDDRLDNKLEIMIYRSVHELVNNALKYAEAENINVQIVQQPDRISLTVQDDGKGFDPAAANRGTGLTNIRTRAESVGGTMNIFSEPGKGTEMNVEFTI